MNTTDVALICKALGDSKRLQIVQMLSAGETFLMMSTIATTSPTIAPNVVKSYIFKLLLR